MNRFSIYPGMICILIAIGVLMVGLWPLNFQVENRVAWLKDTNGIRFFGRGIAHSPGFPVFGEASAIDTDEITIELWLESGEAANKSMSHIITFFDSDGIEYFTLAQWKSHLVILRNMKMVEITPDTWVKLGLRDTFMAGKKRFVTVVSNRVWTSIYLEGDRKRTRRKFTLMEEKRRLSPQFILGSSLAGKNAWVGNIFSLAISFRVLTEDEIMQSYRSLSEDDGPAASRYIGHDVRYLFDERKGTLAKNDVSGKPGLILPGKYRIFQKSILLPPKRDADVNQKDVLTNILGFIPFGFILLAFLSRATRKSGLALLFITLLLGTLLSLAIELLQVYLPSRNSSLTDLVCNGLGMVIGLTLYGAGSALYRKCISD